MFFKLFNKFSKWWRNYPLQNNEFNTAEINVYIGKLFHPATDKAWKLFKFSSGGKARGKKNKKGEGKVECATSLLYPYIHPTNCHTQCFPFFFRKIFIFLFAKYKTFDTFPGMCSVKTFRPEMFCPIGEWHSKKGYCLKLNRVKVNKRT